MLHFVLMMIKMKIGNVLVTEKNLEKYYEFKEEEFLGRTEVWCGVCDGKGHYKYKGKKSKCDECDGSGELFGDGEHDYHSCGDWKSDGIDFDEDTHASIDRECLICHQLSRLHFWKT